MIARRVLISKFPVSLCQTIVARRCSAAISLVLVATTENWKVGNPKSASLPSDGTFRPNFEVTSKATLSTVVKTRSRPCTEISLVSSGRSVKSGRKPCVCISSRTCRCQKKGKDGAKGMGIVHELQRNNDVLFVHWSVPCPGSKPGNLPSSGDYPLPSGTLP